MTASAREASLVPRNSARVGETGLGEVRPFGCPRGLVALVAAALVVAEGASATLVLAAAISALTKALDAENDMVES